ncbi:MAG TPA: sensor histidine kinase [Thermoanaerobaculia bacterium]|nr:sensor histidine kinase [Thermoanaerobaculia bacterium]
MWRRLGQFDRFVSPAAKEAYAPQSFAERLIAVGRLVLASSSLLAIWLDPSTPARFQTTTYLLLIGYVLYAIVAGAIVWRSATTSPAARTGLHVFDLAIFSVLIYLTEGPASPFFVYFVFSLFCAMLRFQSRGILLTAGAAIVIYVGIGSYSAAHITDWNFELNRFIIRAVYLGVLAALLVYLGIYQQRIHRELTSLADWPRVLSSSFEETLKEALARSSEILRSKRLLCVWEEPEEPWRYLGEWTSGAFRVAREPPVRYEPLVHEELVDANFISAAEQRQATVLSAAGTLSAWSGETLNRELRDTYAIGPVLSLNLDGEVARGRLFVLSQDDLTLDDLVLGRIVAKLIVASLDQHYFIRQAGERASAEERLRLSRDLHDGLLQSLTGIALQLQALRKQIGENPINIIPRLDEIQAIIEDDQAELRSIVAELRPQEPGEEQESSLGSRLSGLSERFLLGWGMRVDIDLATTNRIPRALEQEIFKLTSEALANAARHGSASEARVSIRSDDSLIELVIADNGHGFPFEGRFDLTQLNSMKRGPKTLKERITSLAGDLVIESSPRGARLEATIPFDPRKGITQASQDET